MRILLFACFVIALLRLRRRGGVARPLWTLIVELGIGRLDRLGPLPVKAAQILSTRADLIERAQLDRLAVYRSGGARSQRLGRGVAAAVTEPGVLGHGCIATVVARREADAGLVAVKMFRPEAVRALRAQLGQCRRLCRLLTRIGAANAFQLRIAEEIIEQIGRQANVADEADSHRLFAANFGGQARVRVPALIHQGTDRIVMELVLGIDPGEVGDDGMRAHFGRMLLRCLYQMIFTDGCIHGDLHPGNFLVEPDGTLVLLDFGLCWRIGDGSRRQFAEFFLGFIRADGRECARIAVAMALHIGPAFDEDAFTAAVQALLDRSAESVEAFSVAAFAYEMFRVQDRYGIASTTEFVMPIMALISLEGTLRSLAPRLDFKAEARSFVVNCLAGVQKRRASDNVPAPQASPALSVPAPMRPDERR